MRPKHPRERLRMLKANGVHDLMGASQPNLRGKCVVKVEISGAQPSHEVFIPSLPPKERQSWA